MPRIEILDGAIVLPMRERASAKASGPERHEGGICTAAGVPVPASRHIGMNHVILPPERPPALRLAGTWLYGGLFRRHFGHLINESLGRLWALPEHGADCAGILFLHHGRRPGPEPVQEAASFPALRRILDTLGIRQRAVVVFEPLVAERLILPEQALIGAPGVEADVVAAQMAFMQGLVPDARPPAGLPTARIYVSRAGMPSTKGKFILETVIEENLRAAGWGIMRPERHPLPEQIAAYRAAQTLLFAEGSALHVAAPYLGPGKRVGLLWRAGARNNAMRRQVVATGVRDIVECGALTGLVRARECAADGQPGAVVQGRMASSVPDFAEFGRALTAAGFVPPGQWRTPTPEQIAAGIAEAIAERRAVQPEVLHEFVTMAQVAAERG